MARPDVRLRADVADTLLDNLRLLKEALEHPEQRNDPLHDWSPDIRQAYWAVRDAVNDAEARASSPVVRDSQQARVYRAGAAMGQRPYVVGLDAQYGYLFGVIGTAWFKTYFPEVTPGQFVLHGTRSRRISSHEFYGRRHHITLITRAHDTTVLHELAHACHRSWYGTAGAAHDANFVGILLWLVVNACGRDAGLKYAQGIITAGVKYTQLHKQTPPPTHRRAASVDPILGIVSPRS